jgi:hypothetical protein
MSGVSTSDISVSAVSSTGYAADDYNHHVADFSASLSITPLTVEDIDGKKLYFVFDHGVDHSLYSAMKRNGGCHVCSEHFRVLASTSDMNGSICSDLEKIDSTYTNATAYHELAKVAVKYCSEKPITGLRLLTHTTPLLFDQKKEVGGYHHIVHGVAPEFSTDCSDVARIKLIEGAIQRYILSGHFDCIMTRLIVHGLPSVELMESCLLKATYGQTFLPSLKWGKSVLEDLSTFPKTWNHFSPREKIAFGLKHIIRAGMDKDSVQPCVAQLFQTFSNNIIDLLETAHSESAMVSMCNTRLDPTNYQRPTAAASVGQIENAVKALGDFRNTILDYEGALELGLNMVTHGNTKSVDSSSSMTGFAAQMAKATISKTPPVRSFADKCGFVRDLNFTSIAGFMKYCRTHPEAVVEVGLGSNSVAYLARTTLTHQVKYPFLWSFLNGRTKPCFGLYGTWARVSHTICTNTIGDSRNNTFFVCPDIARTSKFDNCCYPEFLSSAYARIAKNAFEGLNTTVHISLPEGQLMAGIGASATATNTLVYPVDLRIDGTVVRLTHLIHADETF